MTNSTPRGQGAGGRVSGMCTAVLACAAGCCRGPWVGPLHTAASATCSARCPCPRGTLRRAPGGSYEAGNSSSRVLTCHQETPNPTGSVDLRPGKDEGLGRGGRNSGGGDWGWGLPLGLECGACVRAGSGPAWDSPTCTGLGLGWGKGRGDCWLENSPGCTTAPRGGDRNLLEGLKHETHPWTTAFLTPHLTVT